MTGLLQGSLARNEGEQHARPGLLSALRTSHAAAVEEAPAPAAPPRSGVLLSERHAVVPPPARVAAAPEPGARGFLQQAKAALSKREYIRVCADGSSYLLPVLVPCLLTLFLFPCVQFQELLQAFKSNVITFEVLAEGAKRALCGKPVLAHLTLVATLMADVATLLRAATDPALFAAFGAFVPAHQQVRGRLSLRAVFTLADETMHSPSSESGSCFTSSSMHARQSRLRT